MKNKNLVKSLCNISIFSLAAVWLSGCIVPTIVSVVALGLDAGSFVTTGKTAKDHGLSLIAQEDCAIMRVLDGKVCRPYSQYEPMSNVAVLEPLKPNIDDFVHIDFEYLAKTYKTRQVDGFSGLDFPLTGVALESVLNKSGQGSAELELRSLRYLQAAKLLKSVDTVGQTGRRVSFSNSTSR